MTPRAHNGYAPKGLAPGARYLPKMGIPRRTTKTPNVDEAARSPEGMHSCPACESTLVQPVNWFEQGEGRWHVDLRCPECDWWGRGAFNQDEVDRFDEELDRGAQELVEDLRSLTRANMEEEADSLAMALASDSILPEDF